MISPSPKRKKNLQKILGIFLFVMLLYFLPQWTIMLWYGSKIATNINDLQLADSALIFGAHLNNKNEVSEILEQRLQGGLMLYQKHLVKELVVSNTQEAAEVMFDYLEKHDVPAKNLYLDTAGDITSDTCVIEKQRFPSGRKVIFASQGFHLPRLMLLCEKLGVKGTGFAVENLAIMEQSDLSWFEIYTIRVGRHMREAGLTWLVLLNLYR